MSADRRLSRFRVKRRGVSSVTEYSAAAGARLLQFAIALGMDLFLLPGQHVRRLFIPEAVNGGTLIYRTWPGCTVHPCPAIRRALRSARRSGRGYGPAGVFSSPAWWASPASAATHGCWVRPTRPSLPHWSSSGSGANCRTSACARGWPIGAQRDERACSARPERPKSRSRGGTVVAVRCHLSAAPAARRLTTRAGGSTPTAQGAPPRPGYGRLRQFGGVAGFASVGSRTRVLCASRTPGPAALE